MASTPDKPRHWTRCPDCRALNPTHGEQAIHCPSCGLEYRRDDPSPAEIAQRSALIPPRLPETPSRYAPRRQYQTARQGRIGYPVPVPCT